MTLKKLTRIFLFSASVVLFASAGYSAASSRFETACDGYKASLDFSASPLKSMQPTPFTLKVTGDDGKTVDGITFSCDLTMPAMAMPPNQPRITSGEGEYNGKAIFTMAGAWQATFTGESEGGEPIELVFDIPDVKMK